MKYLIVVVVVLVVLWLLLGRGRRRGAESSSPGKKPAAGTPMTACAHCGVHLPQPDALFDTQGRAYCGEEHRRLGAR